MEGIKHITGRLGGSVAAYEVQKPVSSWECLDRKASVSTHWLARIGLHNFLNAMYDTISDGQYRVTNFIDGNLCVVKVIVKLLEVGNTPEN